MEEIALWSTVAAGVHVAGMLTAVHSVLHARTSQAAVAWAIALVSFPYLALPFYWVFGRSKFEGYVFARRAKLDHVQEELRKLDHKWDRFPPTLTETGVRMKMLDRLASSPWTGDNRGELLIDGEATFDAIFETIEWAKEYILVQYYILRDDEVGARFTERLVAAAKRGVRVYVLYDEFGCRPEPRRMFAALREVGVRIAGFKPQKGGIRNYFRVNFRNHRKVVLVDGKVACIGGLNVGDEYCGKSPRYGPWRDTHLRVWGPCVEAIQLSWAEDWHWAEGRAPELRWEPQSAPNSDQATLILSTGPADPLESCDLMFVKALQEARQRVWIASPYFIPDPQTKAAMQLAALRGVDVRFLIPDKPDHWLVWHAAWSFFGNAQKAGVRIFRYRDGFLHQKAILVDDDFAAVGTANFDNRSFRLNFEMMALFADQQFASEVKAMLDADFARSKEMVPFDLDEESLWFRLKVRYANLFAQIL
ncbi:MAG: cardiolipin synthase [Planctomycetota bacterium]|jgi:cardiolipin synthase